MTTLTTTAPRCTPVALPCPACGLPLLMDDRACPACDGAGTLPTDGPWANYCGECFGSGMRQWCPACGRGDGETIE